MYINYAYCLGCSVYDKDFIEDVCVVIKFAYCLFWCLYIYQQFFLLVLLMQLQQGIIS